MKRWNGPVAAIAILLSACGGGGGAGGGSDAPAVAGKITGSLKQGIQVVLDDGAGHRRETTTKADGTYSFSNVPEGTYTVTPVVPGTKYKNGLSPAFRTVTVGGGSALRAAAATP